MSTPNAIDPRKPVHLYTDGSGASKAGRPAGWGVTAVQDDRIVWEAAGTADIGDAAADANRMELTAVSRAIKAAPADTPATVMTDSMWCRDVAGEKGHQWRAAGWRNKKRSGSRKEVGHKDLAEKIAAMLETRPRCRVLWIKGHSGNRWNMRADALAKQKAAPGSTPPETRTGRKTRRRGETAAAPAATRTSADCARKAA